MHYVLEKNRAKL